MELTGGRQRGLSLASENGRDLAVAIYAPTGPRTPRPMGVDAAAEAAHAAFVAKLKDPVWGAG